jgi:hypothetical protein
LRRLDYQQLILEQLTVLVLQHLEFIIVLVIVHVPARRAIVSERGFPERIDRRDLPFFIVLG